MCYPMETPPIVSVAASRNKKRTLCLETAARLIKEFLEYSKKVNALIESNNEPDDHYTFHEAYAHLLRDKLYDLLSEVDVQCEWLHEFDLHRLDPNDYPKLSSDSLTMKACKEMTITREEIEEKHKYLY